MYLDYSFAATDFKDLTRANSAVMKAKVDNLGILWKFNIIQDDQWTIDTRHGSVSYII